MRKLAALAAKDIDLVKYCASRGMPWEDIARIVGRSESSLQRNKDVMREYHLGRSQAKLKVAETLFRMATAGRFPVMTIFASKVMLGFNEDGSSFKETASQSRFVKIPGAHFGKVKDPKHEKAS